MPFGMAGSTGAARSKGGHAQVSATFASMLEIISPMQHKDGSYDYLGIDENGDARLTTIYSCGPPTQGGSRMPSGMAGRPVASYLERCTDVGDRQSTMPSPSSPALIESRAPPRT